MIFPSVEPLIRRYSSPLLNYITRMTGDRHRGEELFQEVFLAVWVKRKQYRFPKSFKAGRLKLVCNKHVHGDPPRSDTPETPNPGIETSGLKRPNTLNSLAPN